MKIIKNVITAIGNQKLIKDLKENQINVLCNDISYREGILEFLEVNKNIDYIIINEKIEGEIPIEELIEKIKESNRKIKIILISDSKRRYNKIHYKMNKIDERKIVEIINNNVMSKKTIPINNFFSEETKDGKILTILGANGIGKSIFSVTFAANIKDKKVLIIDFDILNNSLQYLLAVKNYDKDIKNKIMKNNLNSNININDYVIKTKYNVDLISGVNLIFNNAKQSSITKIKNTIKQAKKLYDLIIVDTSSECFMDYTKEMIKMSNQSILISGANSLEIKKAKKLLQIYTEEWNIAKEQLNIIFNKCTKYSIDDEILKGVFKGYNILGKIKLDDYYDLVINKQSNQEKVIKEELSYIREKILNKKIKEQMKRR
ncbi:putative uncharacterized protein [Clostridium sp. CAG:793]|nr:putative uncharacterized protein [Clostridium sp. CAG:793]